MFWNALRFREFASSETSVPPSNLPLPRSTSVARTSRERCTYQSNCTKEPAQNLRLSRLFWFDSSLFLAYSFVGMPYDTLRLGALSITIERVRRVGFSPAIPRESHPCGSRYPRLGAGLGLQIGFFKLALVRTLSLLPKYQGRRLLSRYNYHADSHHGVHATIVNAALHRFGVGDASSDRSLVG